MVAIVFFFQAEDGIRDLVRSRGLGDVYKRQVVGQAKVAERIGVAFDSLHQDVVIFAGGVVRARLLGLAIDDLGEEVEGARIGAGAVEGQRLIREAGINVLSLIHISEPTRPY